MGSVQLGSFRDPLVTWVKRTMLIIQTLIVHIPLAV